MLHYTAPLYSSLHKSSAPLVSQITAFEKYAKIRLELTQKQKFEDKPVRNLHLLNYKILSNFSIETNNKLRLLLNTIYISIDLHTMP